MTIQNQNLIIEGVLGPHEVGVMFAIFLFGLVTIQTFSYYQNYPRDAMGIKVMVRNGWYHLHRLTDHSTRRLGWVSLVCILFRHAIHPTLIVQITAGSSR